MALKDNASLALIPAAYKTSKIYSAIPTDGDGDFTFTRSGNATRINKAGLVETMGTNVGRLNYDLTNGTPASCPSLLLEPIRLNRVYPNNTLSGYSTLNATILNNNATSPDGTNNASKITSSFGGSTIGIYRGFSCNGGNYHNFSVFLKKGTYDRIKVQEGFASANMVVNLTTGTEVSSQNVTNKKIEEYPNGWYRVSFDFISNANNNLQYSLYADGTTATGINFYTFGGQIEQGKGVTSLIPTVGGIVTRNFDDSYQATTFDLSTNNEYSFYIDFEGTIYTSAFQYFLKLENSANGRGFKLQAYEYLGSQYIRMFANYGGGSQRTITPYGNTDIPFFQKNRLAVSLRSNGYSTYLNGTKLTSQSADVSLVWDSINKVDFNSTSTSGSYGRKTNELMVFNTALTDSQLQTLTS